MRNSAASAMMMAREMWIQTERDIFMFTVKRLRTLLFAGWPRTSIVGALGQYPS